MNPYRPEWKRQTLAAIKKALAELQNSYQDEGKTEALAAIDDAMAVITVLLHRPPRGDVLCSVCGVRVTTHRYKEQRAFFCKIHAPITPPRLTETDEEIMVLWRSFPEASYQDLADHFAVSRQRIEQRMSKLRRMGYNLPTHHAGGKGKGSLIVIKGE